MAWAGALLGLLKCMPDLVNLMKEAMAFLKKVSGDDPQGYLKDLGEAFARLNSAQTQEDRTDAAKAIAAALSGMS